MPWLQQDVLKHIIGVNLKFCLNITILFHHEKEKVHGGYMKRAVICQKQISVEGNGVVSRRRLEKQTKESARSADKRPSPGYCVAICFYYAALGHMFVLVGCGRGARPYVCIGWLWAWGSAICFYYAALGYMFLLVGCRR